MLKRLDDITNLPFLLIFCVLSWPFSVLIGIKNLLKHAGKDHGNVLAAHLAERVLKDRSQRRLRIPGVTPKGGRFTTTVVAADTDDDERSYESYASEEDFSDAFDSEVWGTDFTPPEGIHRSAYTRNEMYKGSPLSPDYHHSRTRIEIDLFPEHKDRYGDEAGSMGSMRNVRSCKISGKSTTFLGRSNEFRPNLSLWPMGSIEPINSHSADGGKMPPKKKSLLSLSRMSLRGASVKSSEPSELPSTPKRLNEQISGKAHSPSGITFMGSMASRLKAMVPKQVPRESKSRTDDREIQGTVLRKLKGIRFRISIHVGDSRTSDTHL
ncbi:hypothetical protein DFH28DRAFT_1081483 [Melampsora americana]|nr:hypothetical protein DFH28DRAFT_1081483 [Melampsora americana]